MKKILICTMILLFTQLNISAQDENNLSEEEKLFELSMLWMEARYNFAFFDQVPDLNWDSCYQAFMPQVTATKTDWEHYRILENFLSLLQDGHTRIFPPAELRNKYFGSTIKQLKTRLIEGKVIITEVISDKLQSDGLKIGMEIIEIDNYDVHDYADKFVAPYSYASTKQDWNLQVYGYFLLSGSVSDPAEVKTKDFNGTTKTFDINREPWILEVESFKGIPMSYKVLPNNIGYLDIHNFVDTEEYRPIFDSIYVKIIDTDGLIIDVRENVGGATQITHYVLKHFANKMFKTVDWKSPMHVGAHKAWGQNNDWYEKTGYEIHPFDDRRIYTKPVIVIADESTFSGAEDFCVGFLTMNRGKIIGRKTAGSTGSPLMFNLPGGSLVLICTKEDFFPDGRKIIGVGISPDIEVETTIKDIITKRDAALEIAIKEMTHNY